MHFMLIRLISRHSEGQRGGPPRAAKMRLTTATIWVIRGHRASHDFWRRETTVRPGH